MSNFRFLQRLQCIIGKALILRLTSVPVLIAYLITLSLENSIVLEKKSRKSLEFCNQKAMRTLGLLHRT